MKNVVEKVREYPVFSTFLALRDKIQSRFWFLWGMDGILLNQKEDIREEIEEAIKNEKHNS